MSLHKDAKAQEFAETFAGGRSVLSRRPVDLGASARGFLAAVSIALMSLGGCGASDDVPRAIVRGEVVYDGEPIENGHIFFYPTEETPGPVASAPITGGKYVVTNKGGVPVGKHRVVIEGFKPPPPTAEPDAGRVQFLPAKFHRDSELTAEIPAGEPDVVRNFELSP